MANQRLFPSDWIRHHVWPGRANVTGDDDEQEEEEDDDDEEEDADDGGCL